MVRAFLNESWLPKSILCLRSYDRHKFLLDFIAGVTVGLVALPLAMAFAIASGLTPQAGIYCAVITGFLISALGGSKTQIGGPTGAFVVVVAGIITAHGVDGLFMCTVMAGVLLVIMGTPARDGGEVYSAACHDRIYERDCGPDRQHANQRFIRVEDRQGAGRVLAPSGSPGPEISQPLLSGDALRNHMFALVVCRGISPVFRERLWRCCWAPRRLFFQVAGGNHRNQLRWHSSGLPHLRFPVSVRT